MDLQFYGANCLIVNTKNCRLVIDDNLEGLGAKSVLKPGDVAIYTHEHGVPKVDTKLVIDGPGEYEVAGVSIQGIALRSHIDEAGQNNATLYKILVDDIRLLISGHIYPELNEHQLEAIGIVDVLCIPVGGNGYTLDAVGALTLIKEIEPKLIIPTHYADKTLNYPVPQQSLQDAVKGLAMEPKETVSKLKLKPADFGETTQLVILEKA